MNLESFDWMTQVATWEKWWNKELGRPIFQISRPANEGTAKPAKSLHRFFPMYDFSIPAEKIILDMKEDLKDKSFDDASYPGLWINFGPGVLAALIGGAGNCGDNTIWFSPGIFEQKNIADITVKIDRQSKWFLRLEEFFIAAARVGEGQIQIGQTDIGGTLDVLSSLRPGEMLMYDLYDSPDEVKRLTWEIHAAWFEVFEYFNSLLSGSNHGHSAWAGLLSQKSHYMLQCDFAYMISPDHFAEFVLPELAATCRKIDRPFYHLDGKGQLPHLDHLLSIPELTGIQWIPGAGAPNCSNWPEVYQKIADADRLMQICVDGDVEIIEKVLTQTNRPDLMLFWGHISKGQEKRLDKIYAEYGIGETQ